MVQELLTQFLPLDWEILHIWQRDNAMPGWNGFEPGKNAMTASVEGILKTSLEKVGDPRASQVGTIAPLEAKILDVVLVEPNRWWVGTHVAEKIEDTWPGGVFPATMPPHGVSRAYLKVAEAIAWSEFPYRSGDQVVEIGSSPGGACQRLLENGFRVTGVDPAEMDPWLLKQPHFQHWRAKSNQLKKRQFGNFRWLFCDANVAPNYTLDAVESIVTHPSNQVEGVILTIKMSDWDQAIHLDEHLRRVQAWGFDHVKSRQLSYSRQEYCLAGLRL